MSFRMADAIFEGSPDHLKLWSEIKSALTKISDEEIADHYVNSTQKGKKSLAATINHLINEKLVDLGWNRQTRIFSDQNQESRWTLDFSKGGIAIEVAFNHGEATAWNLVKLVLSAEENHVKKNVNTSVGVVITVKESMKRAGNFDGAVGTFETFQKYTSPLKHMLTVPIMLVGLDSPKSFKIDPISRKIEGIAYPLGETLELGSNRPRDAP